MEESYDLEGPLPFEASLVEKGQPGIWRYRNTFGLPDDAPVISLGEGNTPLVWGKASGQEAAFKCEFLNPSGSFKDRGSATLVSFLRSRGVSEAVEDSSGNAGASFAAYAARGGIKARVFVPEAASGPKRSQIAAYGAEVVPVPGPRTNAAEAVRREAEAGAIYASHAYLPFNIPGYATLAYELVEQLGDRAIYGGHPSRAGRPALGRPAWFPGPFRGGDDPATAQAGGGAGRRLRTAVGIIGLWTGWLAVGL